MTSGRCCSGTHHSLSTATYGHGCDAHYQTTMSHQKSMRSGPANFQFVIHDPSQSPRQRELSASRARAHAARASFQPWYGQGARTVIEPARKRISRDSSAIPDQVNGKSIPSPAGPESGPSGEDARSDNESLLTHAADHHRYNPWQMSFGHRADPFTCLPGSNERVVILALDFCKLPKAAPF